MKGRTPNRYFYHDGTQYILTGNNRLAMSHFHELRAHLRLMKMTNVQNLPIVFGAKEFDDGTVAKFQLIHGQERINVFAPSHVYERDLTRTIKEDIEQIVPCIIVTAENDPDEILGYVACMSGSFKGEYKWFPVPANDGEAVFEGFYVAGDSEYIEDLAFSHKRLLADDLMGNQLLYFKPSGIVPDDDRLSNILVTDTDTKQETYLEDGRWTEDEDDTYIYTAAVGTTAETGGTEYLYTKNLDDQVLFNLSDNTYIQDWYYSIWLGSALACGSSDPECQAQIAALKASAIPVLEYVHTGLNTYAFNGSRTKDYHREYLLIDWLSSEGIRINDTPKDSVFLTVVDKEDSIYYAWNDLGEPALDNFRFSISPCSGCSTIDELITNTLYIVPDGERLNVTEFFGWHISNTEYSETYAHCDLIYQKGESLAAKAISLSSAIAYTIYEYSGYPGELAYIYTGPAADGVTGSISFDIDDAADPYIAAHLAFPGIVSETVDGGLRGDVFLGIVKIEGKEETIIEA